jgi:prepilin-type processing-associated H-X9-DG protein
MLMPYFEEESLYNLYNNKVAWFYQLSQVADKVIPFMVCPSNSGENPIFDQTLNNLLLLAVGQPPTLYYTSQQRLGATTYSYCKGATDAWCYVDVTPQQKFMPPGPPFIQNQGERGLFDMNWAVPIRRVTDGTSKTIAMGEGAGGIAWPVAKARANAGISTFEPTEAARLTPYGPDGTGLIRNAQMAWIIGEPSFVPLDAGHVVGSICMAQTLEPINKTPVSQAFCDVTNLSRCGRSMPGADGTINVGITCKRLPSGAIQTNSCNKHVTSNFRSDHPGGASFLFADGSVHFFGEDINMLTYQRLSTMAGNEVVEIPED